MSSSDRGTSEASPQKKDEVVHSTQQL